MSEQKKIHICVQGMTCHACEVNIERAWKKIPNTKEVHAHASTGKAELIVEGDLPLEALQAALPDSRYTISEDDPNSPTDGSSDKRPSWFRLLGLFALVLLIGSLFSKLGLIQSNFSVGASMGFIAIFLIGLVAASSSCMAVTGGLLLSSVGKYNERYPNASRFQKMRPVLWFVFGRVASYAMLGGLLGLIGKTFSPSPIVTGIITIVAALYMFVMGLEMLHIAPRWLKNLLPRFMPKSLSHRVLDADKKEHPAMPVILGAATFFLPCGFTQALQLYALTTGSFLAGFSTMFAFALGTAPALLLLGFATNAIKGKLGRWFFQFSGALVIILGVWNVQNGLTIIGYPISLPSFMVKVAPVQNTQGFVSMENGVQIVRMIVQPTGYRPSRFVLRAGVPVRWEVEGTHASGCANML
ncbi:hypothetical protein FJZ48_00390, partial [Candidatus Uhrbacteria bacterium]|nr:hypothetical protein [Candidatus Uhrbacteria bacterium]